MVLPFLGRRPLLAKDAWVAPTAAVVGDVTLGAGASVWYGASLRGDVHWIEVGPGSNVQDCATVHVSRGTHPCLLMANVTVGHNAVVHGCTVEDDVLIGMGAVVLDGAVIGAGSIVGAGALVTMDTVVPARSLVVGNPARVVRALTEEEVERNHANALHYVRLARMYRREAAGERVGEPNTFYVDARAPAPAGANGEPPT
jgi:carbonic anhydrase/acetyltransferase-like protein (isoleucine patch superfamily)